MMTVDLLAAWDAEPEPGLESRYTPGAGPEWHAWNEWSPEVEVAEFCGELVRVIRPAVVIETGVGQGFTTRRIDRALQETDLLAQFWLFEADDDLRQAMASYESVWPLLRVHPTPTSDEMAEADLVILDSHWPHRFPEINLWAEHGKPGSYMYVHDCSPKHPTGTGHRLTWQIVNSLGWPTMLFDNPRGSALVYKPEHTQPRPVPEGGTWQARTEPGTTGSVLVAQLDPGTVDGGFAHSMAKMMSYSMTYHGLIGGYIRRHGGPRVYASRDAIVRHFLKATDADWLLQIDSDMTFHHTLLTELISTAHPTERPIVAGHCYMVRGESGPLATMWRQDPLSDNPLDLQSFESYPVGGLVQVDATGAACLLVHRSVFETMLEAYPDHPFPWFEETLNGTKAVGEDLTFCLRARSHGFPIYVHTGLDVGHEKTVTVNQEYFADWRRLRRFVVTGLPRSGTAYVAEVLRKAGVMCGHEWIYTPNGVDWGTRWGDCSWLAVPHLDSFDGPIAVVTRHPLDVLSSIIHVGLFDPSHNMDDINRPYREWIYRQFPRTDASPEWAALQFVVLWHEMVGRLETTFTFKVENMDVETLARLLKMARAPSDTHPTALQEHLDAVPKTINRRGDPRRLTWDDVRAIDSTLSDQLLDIAEQLGYE